MSTYFLIHLCVITIPLVLSFDKKVHFFKKWPRLFPSILLVSFVYIVWDIWFTNNNIWGFNQEHLSGYYLFNLPIEEVLFFITIPYASVFIYEVLKCYFPGILRLNLTNTRLVCTAAILLIIIGFIYLNRQYTFINFLFTAFVLLLLSLYQKKFITAFLLAYSIILIPFIVVNGLLTGFVLASPVVWYNNHEIIGLRIITIPIEDFFYALSLIGFNIFFYELFGSRKIKN